MRLHEPFAVELANHRAGCFRAVRAFRVLDRAKFFLADDAEGEHGAELRERVEQELLELEAVLDAANRLAGRVPREFACL